VVIDEASSFRLTPESALFCACNWVTEALSAVFSVCTFETVAPSVETKLE